jgi:hypothetical protein
VEPIETAGVAFALSLLAMVGAGLVLLAAAAFWLWMLVDCLRRIFPDSTTKLMWALLIVLTHFVGATIYFFLGRQQGMMPGR